jgi:hypothetical protein
VGRRPKRAARERQAYSLVLDEVGVLLQHLEHAVLRVAPVAVEEALAAPVGGLFCAGEIGPVGGRSFLHGFTATLAVFAS